MMTTLQTTPRAAIGGRGLRLLPASALVKTNHVDHANWNYRPLLGSIQRLRFKLVRRLLNGAPRGRLLEIGYGSGVFMPELARFSHELYGIDPHPHPEQVMDVLGAHGIAAKLASGSAEAMPYVTGLFDVVVAVSALEFIPNLDQACDEIRRVMAPGGRFILVTPGHSPMVDLGLKVLTGKKAGEDFGERRQNILPTLLSRFEVERRLDFPPIIQHMARLYTALRLKPHGGR